jgi:hypothetical protein
LEFSYIFINSKTWYLDSKKRVDGKEHFKTHLFSRVGEKREHVGRLYL